MCRFRHDHSSRPELHEEAYGNQEKAPEAHSDDNGIPNKEVFGVVIDASNGDVEHHSGSAPHWRPLDQGFTLIGVIIFHILEFKPGIGLEYQDPWWIKITVAFLFMVNITQAAAVVYMSWNFANPRVVAICLWAYPFTYLTTAILAITNQMFQSWRIYFFTGSRICVGFLVMTSLAACGMGVATAIKTWIFSELAKLVVLQPIVEVNLALQCTVDVTLTVYSNSKTTFPRTDKVFNRLIRTAVQSVFPTNDAMDSGARGISAVFALGILFAFRFAPGTYMFAPFTLPIGRIYTHTMMDLLVSREPLRNNLSTSGIVLTIPNFHATGGESSGAADGTVTLLRNVSTRISAIKANETV
ncbi:hypothetical protein K438DRAFT_1785665 [Mycena galopus ATCC 62051]|nr:hypothetical protein K438DRAFT_1785665 [Mycena galopus ATCC 62051]